MGGFDHKYTGITIQQELQSLHLWAYLKLIESALKNNF